MKIIVQSKFHNKETYVIAKEIDKGEFFINERQWNRAKDKVCGSRGQCCCPMTAQGYVESPQKNGMTLDKTTEHKRIPVDIFRVWK